MTHSDSSSNVFSDTANSPSWPGTTRATTTLHVPSAVRRQLACLSEMIYPFEACGLLIGRRVGTTIEVHDIEQARYMEAGRPLDRHLIHPCRMRDGGLQVVGLWRSRPNGAAEPTAPELDAVGRGYSYLLISVSALGTTTFRSWRRVGTALQAENLSQPRPLRA